MTTTTSATPHVDLDPDMPSRGFGIPYAEAHIDADGYHVVCPACGQKLRSPEGASDEDDVTKGASHAYALHFDPDRSLADELERAAHPTRARHAGSPESAALMREAARRLRP